MNTLLSSSSELLGFQHTFIRGEQEGRVPLLLLPRTGADETSLIPFAQKIWPGASILAVRGRVLEGGNPRFFRRIGKGNFDRDDLALQTRDLNLFIAEASRQYGIAPPIALGHSNGANITWSVLLNGTRNLSGAILLRPMLPFDPRPVANLHELPVLIVAGEKDDIVPSESSKFLVSVCSEAGAQVTLDWINATHDLSSQDEKSATVWLTNTTSSHVEHNTNHP
jgi:phospholipase/carboxylesterase